MISSGRKYIRKQELWTWNYPLGICSRLINTKTKQKWYGIFPEKERHKNLGNGGPWDFEEYCDLMFHTGHLGSRIKNSLFPYRILICISTVQCLDFKDYFEVQVCKYMRWKPKECSNLREAQEISIVSLTKVHNWAKRTISNAKRERRYVWMHNFLSRML